MQPVFYDQVSLERFQASPDILGARTVVFFLQYGGSSGYVAVRYTVQGLCLSAVLLEKIIDIV
jgi:hypothetical protein